MFAKYVAMHASGVAPSQETVESQIPAASPAQAIPVESTEFAEFRQGLRTLQQCFHELEFERAERRRMSAEIRALESRLQEHALNVGTRQEQLEQSISALAMLPSPPSKDEFAQLQEKVNTIDFQPAFARIESVESGLESVLETLDMRLSDHDTRLACQVDARLAKVEERLASILEINGQASPAQVPGQVLAALNELDNLRSSLQAVTGCIGEIEELKHGQSALRDMIAAIEQAMDCARTEAATQGAERVADLVSATDTLKSELRVASERIGKLEATLPEAARSVETAALAEASTAREEIDRIKSQLQFLEEAIAGQSATHPETTGPAPTGDISVIKENLDEIRRFMVTLSSRL